MKQIRKTYREVNPELLLAEIRDFAVAQGLQIIDTKQETYTLPDESASFITRGTMVFGAETGKGKENLRVHVVGSARDETKLMLDVDDKQVTEAQLTALMDNVDFIFSSYEAEEA